MTAHCLLSLPPGMVADFAALTGRSESGWLAASDPEGARLGSGGGASFWEWLRRRPKLLVHGGGQSRRLPAYAAVGKPFIPVPVLRRSWGRRLDQTLLDFQLPAYRSVLARASAPYVALVTSGDVLLRFGPLEAPLPEADVLAFGMEVAPEVAQHFGVFFSPQDAPENVAFFLQKPPAARIRELSARCRFLIDTGMWLLSERAVETLLLRCGWDDERQEFRGGAPAAYELYAGMGLGLGSEPQIVDVDVNALRCAVVSLREPEFYHSGRVSRPARAERPVRPARAPRGQPYALGGDDDPAVPFRGLEHRCAGREGIGPSATLLGSARASGTGARGHGVFPV